MAQNLIAICSCSASFWDTDNGWRLFRRHCDTMKGNTHHWVEVTDLSIRRTASEIKEETGEMDRTMNW